MEAISSRYDLSNGELRFRIKLLEEDLRELQRRLHQALTRPRS